MQSTLFPDPPPDPDAAPEERATKTPRARKSKPAAVKSAATADSSSLSLAPDPAAQPDPPAEPKSRPTLYILDSYALIYQVFHAIPLMTAPDGRPTNAVFGIFRDVLNLLRDQKPDYIAAAFDGAGPVFRSDILPEYKAQRAAMPDDLIPQIDLVRRVFEGFDIPVLIREGFEADDVIATLARAAEKRGLDVVICTSDKDARQLINDHVSLLNLRKKQVVDAAFLMEDWGVRPDQVVDTLALAGDTSDNIPGVPGIGVKTAAGLLRDFGDLESLLARVNEVTGAKRRESLKEHAETARRARTLVVLRDDVPLDLDWDRLRVGRPHVKALRDLCVECGFHRFVDELNGFGPDLDAPPKPVWQADYRTIDTPERLAAFADDLAHQAEFCVDTETTGVDPLRADLVGISIAWAEGTAYYLPVRAPEGAPVLDVSAIAAAIGPILDDPKVAKIGQNIKYDLHVLERHGLPVRGPLLDTMLMSHLLDGGERNHGLDQLSRRLLEHDMIPIDALIGKGRDQITMDRVDVAKVAEYAGEDADATRRIERILAKRVVDEGLWTLYAELEEPLIQVLARMESAGVKVDVERLRRLSDEFATRLAALETQVHALAGRPFNLASAQQLREILFDDLKLPVSQKTPGGEPSTAQDVLEELAGLHPLPKLLIEHRTLAKLKGTYLDALPALVNPRDGRIHSSFHQASASTGRLSSSDPNLQNIPVRTDEGRQIRQAFVPGTPGWKLLNADYSQVELRILAHFSGDPALKLAFENDRDVHAVVAAQVFGVPEAEVQESQRRVAKMVNFGVVYGLSAFGLAARLGIPQADAALFIDAYFKEYAGVDAFITRVLEEARDTGRVVTILGRRRPISGIKNTTGRQRNLAERTAINAVVQGSAADLIKRAMLDVDARLHTAGLRARMLLQIHDELVFECPDDEVQTLAALVRDAMTNALKLDVPLKVDVAAGPNWLDVEDVPAAPDPKK